MSHPFSTMLHPFSTVLHPFSTMLHTYSTKLQPTICLKWVTERPLDGGSCQSPDFELLQSTWYLKIYLRDTTCIIELVPRGVTDASSHKYASSSLSEMDLLLKIGERSFCLCRSGRTPVENGNQLIFPKSMSEDEIRFLRNVDEWTVFCIIKRKDFTESLQVGNMTATMSFGFRLTADKCDQVSQEVPQNILALSSDISSLLEDGILPDFKLMCGGRTFPVHKSVLAARSEVLRDKFHNQMQESLTQSCDIQDVEVHVLEALLKFLYSGKLDDLTEDTIPKLWEAADKYAVRSLIEACCYWMIRNLSEMNCINYLKIADLHSNQDLRHASVSFIVENPRMFKSESWLAFFKEHPSMATEVLQKYAESSCQ